MILNGAAHEDVVIRLFSYTSEGSVGSWYFSLPVSSIRNGDTFQVIFPAKFGDERSITSLINDTSNLKANSDERIKYFNSRFNKLLKKIVAASKPSADVPIYWYISSLPSNITIFVGRANRAALVKKHERSCVCRRKNYCLIREVTNRRKEIKESNIQG